MSKLLQTIFSVKNDEHKKHKIVTLFGIKIKFMNKFKTENIYIGCGDDYREGYIGCDIRKTKNTKIVCKAWELSKKQKNLKNIYSRHMCEHLTFQEFEYTLQDWYRALAPQGKLEIIVPNLDFHIEQFKKAKFDWENLITQRTDLNWALAGFWGWQRENYISGGGGAKSRYWDVHKSGYNIKLMELFLKENGYKNIQCTVSSDNVHLIAKATKP